jgi:hypothetical protein
VPKYEVEIDHQLIRSAVTRAIVCSACGKVCVSYESQTEPCPKLSIR